MSVQTHTGRHRHRTHTHTDTGTNADTGRGADTNTDADADRERHTDIHIDRLEGATSTAICHTRPTLVSASFMHCKGALVLFDIGCWRCTSADTSSANRTITTQTDTHTQAETEIQTQQRIPTEAPAQT